LSFSKDISYSVSALGIPVDSQNYEMWQKDSFISYFLINLMTVYYSFRNGPRHRYSCHYN